MGPPLSNPPLGQKFLPCLLADMCAGSNLYLQLISSDLLAAFPLVSHAQAPKWRLRQRCPRASPPTSLRCPPPTCLAARCSPSPLFHTCTCVPTKPALATR